MTIREALRQAQEELARAGIADACTDARLLLMETGKITSSELLLGGGEVLDASVYEQYRAAISRRREHVPLQYITGEQEFMGLPFRVSSAVLIPRQDTEHLVEAAIPYCEGKKVLDLCTGSGCIIVSIAKLCRPRLAVGTDLSGEAILVARENADALSAEVEFVQGDLFENVEGVYDVIVSNPPYIRTDEIPALMPEVRDYEPHMALDGDVDGLRFYRRIVAGAGAHLAEGGMLFFEIGCGQAEAVVSCMEENGFGEIVVKKDYAGLDRVVYGQRIFGKGE